MGPKTKKKRHLSRAIQVKSAADLTDPHVCRCPDESETRAISITFVWQLADVVQWRSDVDGCYTVFDTDTPAEHHRAGGI